MGLGGLFSAARHRKGKIDRPFGVPIRADPDTIGDAISLILLSSLRPEQAEKEKRPRPCQIDPSACPKERGRGRGEENRG